METFERILISITGSFAGFLLGIATIYFKEQRDRRIKLQSMRTAIRLLSEQLQDILHEDPKLTSWLKIESLFQFFDLLNEPTSPKKEFNLLISIYSQWTRGFFMATGIKSSSCQTVKNSLKDIANSVAETNLNAQDQRP